MSDTHTEIERWIRIVRDKQEEFVHLLRSYTGGKGEITVGVVRIMLHHLQVTRRNMTAEEEGAVAMILAVHPSQLHDRFERIWEYLCGVGVIYA